MAGIPLHKTYNSAMVEACGYDSMTFIEKDCRNYIEQVRRLRLGDGDVAAIKAYFATMQARRSGFYFNNRCRQAYKEFGDVVTFDTTYLTNKYDMPFAPFVGLNHHGQSMLLGCGLIANEDTSTFVWLFRTWLQCMYGQTLKGIITDQDRALQNAIQIVFPHTMHRWCLWHILKKLPEKFDYHVDKASIFSTIHGLVYDSQIVEEFEEWWKGMIDRYNLYDSDWLSGLFESRCRWVPYFLKTTFWAGMLTTQRSESMNAFFDGYVHSKTSLKQFFKQYERALRSKVEKEFQADFKSYAQMVPCVTNYDMETQFQKVYTISKFREVQDEFIGKVYCDIISISEGCSGTIYKVLEDVLLYGAHRTKRTFFVSFTRETRDIFLSDKFILRRWRRDVSRAHTRVAVYYDGLVSSPAQLRYDDMCRAFSEVADLVANDEEWSSAVMDWIKLQAKELKSSCGSHPSHVISCGTDSQNRSGVNVLDPVSSKRSGAPRKLRRKGLLELTLKKAKATSTSTKGKRPTGQHSTAEEVVSDVDASQQFLSLTSFACSQSFMGDSGRQQELQ
ncbi:protein FAR1-RELATED SEQUENCE 5-like [Olea europaea var. sylvestris]|uniref:protein FAR1-RELATED SEQUENCE 5-like n=1 Tax=Olea europaea var. sylvestris TaxID=158386 RepID=UPI000C1D0374|nr:protein FAR1-RELATED SEQUENCE 5-like [Olea europaea var. sylvestris]